MLDFRNLLWYVVVLTGGATYEKYDKRTVVLTPPYTVKDIEYYAEYYDEKVIPDAIGKAHPKGAITLRNKWMVDTADLIVAYIEREEGGAYATVKYAIKHNKSVINISRLGNDCVNLFDFIDNKEG